MDGERVNLGALTLSTLSTRSQMMSISWPTAGTA